MGGFPYHNRRRSNIPTLNIRTFTDDDGAVALVSASLGSTALGTGSTEADAAVEAVRRWYADDALSAPAVVADAPWVATLRAEIDAMLMTANKVLITGNKVDGTPYHREVTPIRIDRARDSKLDLLVCRDSTDSLRQFRVDRITRAEEIA